ncbi:MAG: hypothetical protein GC136_07075 [Alphaproteobacteria bacterium]|nr:hypothetical protein [Alphaproteobacteria bacterium]
MRSIGNTLKKHTITFGFPDKETLEALGRLVIMQAHLEYIFKMTYKSLNELSISEALKLTERDTGAIIRKDIQKIAKRKLCAGSVLTQLLDLIDRAWKAAMLRNQYVHNIWARLDFADLQLQNNDWSWRKAPEKQEISDLTYEISNILAMLNDLRFSEDFKKSFK